MARGISNSTKAVNLLQFHEKDAAQNGLFIGHLEDVSVEWSTTNDVKTPRLSFHFASNHANVSERRHVYQSIFPVESSVDTIPGGKYEWRVNNVFRWIKHMLDVFYLKGKELSEEAYATLFTNTAAILNGTFGKEPTNKPYYKNADGKPISLWMKLLRHKKRKNEWINVGLNGELAFDTMIGSGIIEIQKPNTPPAILRLDMAKESITPTEVNKAPTIGGPVPMNGSVIAPMPGFTDNNGAFNAAGVEMPF